MALSNLKFEQFFSSVYAERWGSLYKAMQTPVRHVLRQNKYADLASPLDLKTCEFLDKCYWAEGGHHTLQDSSGLNLFYKMDPASIFVAKALSVQPGENVLDMCAAPGGKSLVLAEALDGEGQLISNEISKDRRERLMRVFQDYIPKEKRQNIFVKGLDGNKYGLTMADHFDAVLCDVPCSGERHLLENVDEFNQWTEKRTKNLAVRQYSLLSSAWLATRAGGRIVYSTCSISPYENDEIVAKLKKRRDVVIVRDESLKKYNFIEETELGYRILPDILGFGPMYFSIVTKV